MDMDYLDSLREYMSDVLHRTDAVGLSAPQVGVFKRLILVRTKSNGIIDLVNPMIVRMYGSEARGFESCLSIPPFGNGCSVPRMEIIDVISSTVKTPGNPERKTFYGHDARIVQHEVDHLDGTFFVDRASPSQSRVVISSFNQWKSSQQKKQNT